MRSRHVLLSLMCAALAAFSNAFRRKETSQVTPLHFELPQEDAVLSTSFLDGSDMQCGATTPSPYWKESSKRTRKGLLKIPSGDKGWDKELNVLLKEPAINDVWYRAMEVWNCSATNVATKAKALLNNQVPGLNGITFQTVFKTLHDEGCPVWILGGSIRDLISGKKPKDIDTSALCEVTKIQTILRKKKWKVYINKNYKYYEIGTRGAEDGMEGKSIDTLYTSSSIVDWTANMLLLDPIRMYVIDPSGRGISDAKKFTLAPATPKPLTWDQWNIWKTQETQPRYYRYLKFRLRGWQPYNNCFRYFVADEIAKAIEKELEDPNSQMPMWLFLSQQLEDDSKRSTVQKHLLSVLEEDLTRGYFEWNPKKVGKCGAKDDFASTLSTADRKKASGLRRFKETLVDGCKKPPRTWVDIARRKKVDLAEACKLIENFYKWSRGGAYVQFKEGNTVFFKTKRGALLDGVVKKVYKTKKQIDWSYDIIDKEGKMLEEQATAKRVLQRTKEKDE